MLWHQSRDSHTEPLEDYEVVEASGVFIEPTTSTGSICHFETSYQDIKATATNSTF